MAHFKIYCLLVIALFGFSTCKKIHKNKLRVLITGTNTLTQNGIGGAKYIITEVKSSSGNALTDGKPTGWKLEGYTEEDGSTLVEFKPKWSLDYTYAIQVIDNGSTAEGGPYTIKKGGGSELGRSSSYYVNKIIIDYMPFGYRKLQLSNVNCQGPLDSLFFDSWFLNSTYIPIGYYPNLYVGCDNFLQNEPTLEEAGNYIYRWDVTRSGITTNHQDTFFVAPNATTIINLEY